MNHAAHGGRVRRRTPDPGVALVSLDDDERLDQAIERFGSIVERLQARQDRLEHRLATLCVAIAFTVVVASLSFLVIILFQQLPGLTAAIG